MSTVNPAPNQGMQGFGSPVSDEWYNVLTALQSKLEGLEAYRKYAQDAVNPQLWQYLAQVDTQAVQYLQQELERLVQTGQHRLRQPGQTSAGQGQGANTPHS
jgi:hypothetical protein